jgi:hypothetical protein
VTPVQPGRRWPRLLTVPLSLLLILATVVAGREIIRRAPDYDSGSRPYIHAGHVGDTVDGRTFSVVVASVHGAGTVRARFDEDYRTDGVFVAVRATVTAYSDAVLLEHVAVVDRSGRTFVATPRFFQEMGGYYRFQPAIPVSGEIVFEVPRDAAAGLVLQLSADQILDRRNQTIAQVELGIGQSTVDAWLSGGEPLELTGPEVAR